MIVRLVVTWFVALPLTNGEIYPRDPLEKLPDGKVDDSSSRKVSWVTEFPSLPILFASSSTLPNGRCEDQTRRYSKALDNSTLWAVQMFDASTKYPDGMIYGHQMHLGNFDQCYDLGAILPPNEASHDEKDEVEGRYCLIKFQYRREKFTDTTENRIHTLDFDPTLSVWEVIEDKGDYRRKKRNAFYMALCVPATCTSEDVALAIGDPIKEWAHDRGLIVETSVDPAYCQARRDSPRQLTLGSRIFCASLFVLLLLVIASSWYDERTYSDEEAATYEARRDIFVSFSARRSLRYLRNTSDYHPGLDCIHAIRFVLTITAITGHRMIVQAVIPVTNVAYYEKLYYVPPGIVIFNSQNLVDGFFGFGGLLLSYHLLNQLDCHGRLSLKIHVLPRFLRMTPLYMMVVFFHATLLPQLDVGPLWKACLGSIGEHCAKYWWTNLLNINNYVNPDKLCILQSWYLSVDFQLYLMGTMLTWVFWKLPRRLGYFSLIFAVQVGLAVCFYVVYTEKLLPISLKFPFLEDPREDPYFVNYYVKSHLRITPYLVGVLSGAILHDYKKSSTRKMSKSWSRLLFVVLVPGSVLASQIFGSKYYDPNYNYLLHPVETATYACLYRASFAFAICAAVVLVTIGDGLEKCRRFMTPRWAKPLAKLTYSAYLLHNVNQLYDIGVIRGSRGFFFRDLGAQMTIDVMVAFGLSFISFIVVENPVRRIIAAMIVAKERNDIPSRSIEGAKRVKKVQ